MHTERRARIYIHLSGTLKGGGQIAHMGSGDLQNPLNQTSIMLLRKR